MTPAETVNESRLPWRALIGFTLLFIVVSLGPDLAPSQYWPELDHYIPRYILLAFAVGFGLSAIRSGQRLERLLGLPVLLVSGYYVIYIIRNC